jgi:nickel transport protein
MKKIILILLLAWSFTGTASAHGIKIEYSLSPVMAVKIELAAASDTGEPLANAGVSIYAPSGSGEPWQQRETGPDGRFRFLPDVRQPGLWTVTVMQDERRADLRIPLEFSAGEAGIVSAEGIEIAARGLAVQVTIISLAAVQIELKASFESGEAMSEGQVTVYAPDDPKTPWLTGLCDGEGRFVFAADSIGTWEIQVRKAGHGEWLKIPITADTVQVIESDNGGEQTMHIADSARGESGSSYSTGQIILMAASVAWGLVGTALYFSRRSGGKL